MAEETTRADGGTGWGRRLFWGGAAAVVLVVAIVIASATVPRWWAHRVGEQVGGSITQGVFVGLFYGFLFTLLPLLVLVLVLRWRLTVRTVVVALVVAFVLALPNVMTLGIVLGTGNAAHAGDRVLDVEAPAFRGASLVGALIAVLLVALVFYLLGSRSRARRALSDAGTERPAG